MRTALWRVASTGVVLGLFAVCGAWSSGFYAYRGVRANLTPVPFALLCGIVLRNKPWTPLSIAGIFLAWYPAQICAICLAYEDAWSYPPMIVGGFVGGFLVTLAAGVCQQRALSPLYVAGGSGLGAIAALPFVSWLPTYRHSAPALGDVAQMTLAFAIWQAVVGTYLFVLTRNSVTQTA